jgi:hypothetical protein
MPNRIPTPGIAPVGVRSAATDNAAVNVKQHGTVGGQVKGTVKAAGPKSFNKLAK